MVVRGVKCIIIIIIIIMVALIRIRKNRLAGYRDIDGRFQLQRNNDSPIMFRKLSSFESYLISNSSRKCKLCTGSTTCASLKVKIIIMNPG